jgi:zinc-ribbon domain
MSYCINCGSQLQPGAKFCSTCGTAVATEEGRSTAAEVHRAARAGAPVTRAVPVVDYVRDGLAAFALIISLFMVWQAGDVGTGRFAGDIAATHLDVVVITLLSLASLSIPYLWRAGVFGPSWGYAKTQDARLLANAPYFLLVVIYLVIEIVEHPGLGPAMAFGLAGAILAAQPRSSELADGDVVRDRRWIVAVLAIAGLVVVLTLIQIIEAATQFDATSMVVIALLALGNAALLSVVAVGVVRGSDAWRLVGIGIGVVGAIFGLLSLSPQFVLTKVTTMALFPSFSLVFWMAFGAAVAAPSVSRLMTRTTPESVSWMPALRPVLDLAIGVNALMAVASIVAIIRVTSPGDRFIDAVSPVPFVLALIFGVVGVASGFLVRTTLRKDPRQGHRLATGYAGLLFVLGLALVAIWSVLRLGNIAPLTLLIAFAFPAALAVILWGTPAVREYFRTLPDSDRADRYSFAGTPRPAKERREPVAEPRQSEAAVRHADADRSEPATGVDFLESELAATDATPTSPADATGATAVLPDFTEHLASPERPAESRKASGDQKSLDAIRAEAANRRTSAVRLREIASTVPEARAAVASNPKAYPDLLIWLGNLGDPDVDEALERRQR